MKKTISIIATLLICSISYAQDNNSKLLDKLVEKNIITQSEAEEILLEDDTTTKPNSFEKVRDIFNNPYLQLSGYGILKYEYDDTQRNHHDFKPRVVYLTIAGKVDNKFRYSVLFDLANPKLHELWGEWTASDYFNLKAGQFKVPLMFENQFAPGNLEYGAFSRLTAYIMGHQNDVMRHYENGKSQNNIGRDLGIQASGSLIKVDNKTLVEYAVGLFQGSGINTSDPDNTKNIASSIIVHPITGLRIGGGTYFGSATYAEPNIGVAAGKHVRNRWTVSADYRYDRFYTRAEYVRANDGGVDREGAYGMAMWDFIPKKFNILGKAAYYNDYRGANREAMDYTVGFNYNIFALSRVQLNYTYSDYTKNWGAKDAHNVLVQLQVGF